MEYEQFGNRYVVRLDKGEDIPTSLKKICHKEEIRSGTISGIGAVNKAVIGLFETAAKIYHSKEYTGDMEITSLSGNISRQNDEVYLHIHACLGDSTYGVFGGHLNSAIVSATVEIVIDVIEGSVGRKFSEEIGLNLLDFSK